MPKLNEYLGSIISSVSTARVMADIHTAKVAEDYAKHDLLQHFSVPRMRVDDVEITIPVALDQAQAAPQKTSEPVDIIDNKEFNSAVYKEITRSLGVSSLPRAASSEVRSILSKNTQQLEDDINRTQDISAVNYFGQAIAENVSFVANKNKLIKSSIGFNQEQLQKNIANLAEQRIKAAAPSASTDIGDLQVIAESHLLKEQNPEHIMQIKMKISEDGMEWQKMEDADGNTTKKLLPE